MSGASVATRLVELAEGSYRLGLSDDGMPFAVANDGPAVALRLRGPGGLRSNLARLFFTSSGDAANGQALSDALAVLEARCFQQPREPVALRVAAHADGIVLDLGRADGMVVIIKSGRWYTTTDSPVLFRRTALTGELPEPDRDGAMHALRGLLNITDESWQLLVGWLVSCLLPTIPHPIPLLTGEHGTGKTTAATMVANTIDLSPASARSAPASVRDWAVAAAGSWAVPIDNLSTIPPWLSDALCRAVTGDGLVSRELYTDDGLSILAFRRCIILTSIDPGALRGDLADRLMPIELQRICNYRDDAGIAQEFRNAHPKILGGLLHLTAQVLAELPNLERARLPRMADFARVLLAVDKVVNNASLDGTSNSFKAYLGLTGRVMQMAFEDDPVAQAVAELMDKRGEWSGTAAELLDSIKPDGSPKTWPEDWPRTARGLAGRLRRAIPVLRNVTDIEVSFSREGHRHTRTITLRYDSGPKTPSAPSAPSADGSEQGEHADDHADGELPMRTVEGFADGRGPSSSEVPSACGNGSEQVIRGNADDADDADGVPGPLSSQMFDELGWVDRYPDEFATESEEA